MLIGVVGLHRLAARRVEIKLADTALDYGIGENADSAWDSYVAEIQDRYQKKGIQDECKPKKVKYEGDTYKGVVLLLHGFTACPQQFDDLIPLLTAKGYTVLAPLLPGHGAQFWKFGEKDIDYVDFLPTEPREYEAFAEQMNAIMDKVHGETALFGLSVGGAVAAYAGAHRAYTRQLITVPLIHLLNKFGGKMARYMNGHLLAKHGMVGWGQGCIDERKGGRAGICTFRIEHAVAARDFGSRHLDRMKAEGPLPQAQDGHTQFVFSEGDTVVSGDKVRELATAEGIPKGSPYACGFPKPIPHSFLSAYDAPNEDKFWLKEITDKVAAYLTDGTLFAQDGILGDESENWPQCALKCSECSTECPCVHK